MTVRTAARRLPVTRALGVLVGVVPRVVTHARRNPPPETFALAVLLATSVLLFVGGVAFNAELFPPVGQVLPLLVGGLVLRRAAMRRLLGTVVVLIAWDVLVLGLDEVRPGALVVLAGTGVIAHEFARSRDETGLGGLRGDSVLVELRRRLAAQGALPPLEPPWFAEIELRPAGGSPFAGDFVVSSRGGDGRRLDLALVDVSGKGIEAGSRSLLLSGALGGLLGALPPESFLAAANDYLVEQEWEEGFATAVHLSLDLETGAYRLVSAGHPPVAHFDAGSGRWSLLERRGPALGLVRGASYDADCGVLHTGDALLLYTDGLVETSGRDLHVGIDKLLGAAEHLVARGFHDGAATLVDQVAGGSPDDRGLVLLWRER